jgi:RHS repeat-associated protein
VDYAGTGAFPLAVVRHYNSRSEARGAFGAAWRGDFERSLRFDASGTVRLVMANRPDGRVYAFAQRGSDWVADADVAERLLRDTDASGNVTGWRLTTTSDETEFYDAAGRLVRVSDRAGRSVFMQYDPQGRPAAMADDFGRSLSFGFDADGRVASFTDPDGHATRYQYNADEMLSQVIYPDGAVRSFVYNEPAYTANTDQPAALTGIVDENGDRFAIFRYDDKGRAISSSHVAAGNVEVARYEVRDRFVYDTGGRATVTDPLGTSRAYNFQISFNAPRATSLSQPCATCGGASATTAYDPTNASVTRRTDFNGVATTYQHADPYGRTDLETQRTEAVGLPEQRTIATQWHPSFRLPVAIVEPAPGGTKTTRFTYDASGNLLERAVTAPKNDGSDETLTRTSRWTYATFGRLLSATDPNGNVTAYSYYADDDPEPGKRGSLAAVVNAAGHVSLVSAYDAAGRPLTTIDPNGLVTTLAYDVRGRPIMRQVGVEITRYAYDKAGQLVEVTQPDGSLLRYTYDSAHRLVRIEDGRGNRIVYTLDAAGNRIAENVYDATNALARTRSRVYDSLNRLYQDLGAQNQATTYAYDGNGNVLTITDPLGHKTWNFYDGLNRVTRVAVPDLYAMYAYDAGGNVSQLWDSRRNATAYTHDGFGDVVRQVSPDTGTTTSRYDAAGNLVERTDARGATATHIYDTLNRAARVVHSRSESPDEVFVYAYDAGVNAKGRLSQVSDPAATTNWTYDSHGRVTSKSQRIGGVSQTVSYGYNPVGQLTSLTTPSGQAISYSYSNNRASGMVVNGIALITGAAAEPFGPLAAWIWGNGSRTFRDYDNDGRLVTWEFRNGMPVLRNDLSYDTAGRIVAIADPIHAAATQSFQYDDRDRLTLAQTGNPVLHTRQFTYDPVGNRQTAISDGVTVSLSYSATSNRLQSMSGTPASYFRGAAAVALSYSNANRLASIESAETPLATYAVNALGQRVRKTVDGVTTLFVYDESGKLLGEYDAAGNLIQETVWLEDLPVATLRPTGAQGIPTPIDVYYVHADHLGTPRAVSRPADNAIAWQWKSLDPFGSDLPDERPTASGVFRYNLRFPGQYYDAETGLHYNYFRDYDPTIGRYVESDPIGLGGGLNTYAYVLNAPLSYGDLLGLLTCGSGFNEGLVPDNPFGHPFSHCCKRHDDCYDNCFTMPPKMECDENFCKCMLDRCNGLHVCSITARMYCDAAKSRGQGAFDSARKKCGTCRT